MSIEDKGMKQRCDIAVAGFGTAGALVAGLLAQQGHRVTIFEQAKEVGPVGAGILLQPSGQMVLRKVGLLEEVISGAEPVKSLYAVTHRRRVLMDLAYARAEKDWQAWGIHRGVLFSALANFAQRSGAAVKLGVRAVSVENDGEHAKLVADGGEVLGDFDFVVACDGARSELRARNTPAGTKVHEYPHGAVWAIGRCEAVHGWLWQVCRGTKRLCGVLAMGGGRASLFWSLRKDEKDALYGGEFSAWRDEVTHLCPEATEFFQDVKSFADTRFTTYCHVTMRRPWRGRCVFLGDAAHAMSPHLGQGANLALLDAYAFAEAVKGTESAGEAFEAYEKMRRGHTRFYSFVTRMLSPFFQSRGFVKGWGRDIFLPWMCRTPGLRGTMAVTMSGMRRGWMGGRLGV
jgi:2-polyprenyl-6-methoxyphenol hydroxylase-like FAD-dependent oxidoreductase